MAELFIEIGVEEIPVAEINPAVEYLSGGIRRLLESEQINFKELKIFSTPRRLALFIDGLADKGKPSVTVYTGPRKESAFDKDGNPTQAVIGFARSKGVDVKSLKIVRLEKGEFVQAEVKSPGIKTKEFIQIHLSELITNIPFKKSMRWGNIENSTVRFIRPIRWLVVLYNNRVMPVIIGDIKASAYTYGLRTGGSKKIKVTSFDAWREAMEGEMIIPDPDERKDAIKKQAKEIADKIHAQAQPDIELLDAITNLIESPVAILGSFDKRFMNLPQEVIMSVMKTHQRYIPVVDSSYNLMPYFVGISNNPYGNNDLIKKGYERVLNARLEDAEFYYHEDIKQPLEAYIELLKGMVYNPLLGSLYDKAQRIKNIASYLCDEIKVDGDLKAKTLKAAELCKADLATRLVSEFPELQGIIGKHYLLIKDQEAEMVASAIAEHRNLVPSSMPGQIVSVADKMDSLVGFFSIGEVPTGTQDPYGLRRAVMGIINTIIDNEKIDINIKKLIEFSIEQYKELPKMPAGIPSSPTEWRGPDKDSLKKLVLSYIYGRLEGVLRERYATEVSDTMLEKAGSPVNKLINAVLATEPENIAEANHRIDALKDIVFKPDFEPILLAFKRVINISKNHNAGEIRPDLLIELSEKFLYNKYLELQPEIGTALANKNYIGYINLIGKLVEPINTFFDKVLVMSEDKEIRNNRLNLLAKIKNLVMQVLDITKIL